MTQLLVAFCALYTIQLLFPINKSTVTTQMKYLSQIIELSYLQMEIHGNVKYLV